VTSPAVAAALKSRFTREGSADTALMTKPPSHKGHGARWAASSSRCTFS
jgi:hypothetical protein